MTDISTLTGPPQLLDSPPKIYPSPPNEQDKNTTEASGDEARISQPPSIRIQRKPVPVPAVQFGDGTLTDAPSSPVKVEEAAFSADHQSFSAQIEDHGSQLSAPSSRSPSDNFAQRHLTPPPDPSRLSPAVQQLPVRTNPSRSSLDASPGIHHRSPSGELFTDPSQNQLDPRFTPASSGKQSSENSLEQPIDDPESYQPLQYFHQGLEQRRPSGTARRSSQGNRHSRTDSRISSGSEWVNRGRDLSPSHTPDSYVRARSTHSMGRSPEIRPMSYVDLLNVPYPQAPPVSADALDNSHLRNAVGNRASLLSTKQTLEMYRANVKKTNDAAIQYEFAIFMISCAQEAALEASQPSDKPVEVNPSELLKEARHILQRLADRSYPFAQYYLADGFASGLFNRGKEDYDRAFPLFMAAAKHAHAEAGYRAGLCYEFGWGTRADANKAVQFYRQSASKNHPGAMLRLGRACLTGDLGLVKRYREGVKWLKRAAESADFQYNAAPYELGVLHETGYGDDIFQDESYAAQLFTKSADLGHPEANYRLGDAYEHGRLSCPKDPALSVHFYTGAAQRGHPSAMMALCAWYMVGAQPILEKDENEAYEWARKAAELGLPKAEYCVGYFTETGIGCRRDPLEANVWYVRAAEHGDERARHRLQAIRAAGAGADPETAAMAANLNQMRTGSGQGLKGRPMSGMSRGSRGSRGSGNGADWMGDIYQGGRIASPRKSSSGDGAGKNVDRPGSGSGSGSGSGEKRKKFGIF